MPANLLEDLALDAEKERINALMQQSVLRQLEQFPFTAATLAAATSAAGNDGVSHLCRCYHL